VPLAADVPLEKLSELLAQTAFICSLFRFDQLNSKPI